MKKIISYLFIVSILSTMLFSNTSKHNELVEEYLIVSGQDTMYTNLPTEITQMVEQQFSAKGEKIPENVENILIEEFNRDSTVAKLTEEINALPIDTLKKLIIFYNSNLGKRLADINKNEGAQDVQEKLPTFAQTLQDNPPSKTRIKNMNIMFTETNVLTGTLKMIESVMRIYDVNTPKEKRMSEEKFNNLMTNMKMVLGQQLIITYYYLLRDFSDEDVEKVVHSILSDEIQAETDAQITGLTAYFNTATENVIKLLKK